MPQTISSQYIRTLYQHYHKHKVRAHMRKRYLGRTKQDTKALLVERFITKYLQLGKRHGFTPKDIEQITLMMHILADQVLIHDKRKGRRKEVRL
jgi:hypothetical protein